ncbi:cation diffusion facilitator family transporter [Parasediminibacterium sp. JCM 36343]|uniref:cation diffusion facilitator family transporter n=1 Tax=Parasediminibacterium sp. JCM 36343 TaxID=3374279 RepID=UPI003978BB57
MQPAQQNFRVQLWITILSVVLFATKIAAYYLTNSLAILTDALESIVNVLAGFIGLYSLYIVTKPKDKDHPYGHGKAEFVSAAAEGTLIIAAGCLIIYQAITSLLQKKPIESLDTGLILVAITAIINYAAGYACISIGKKNKSLALLSSGKHLQLDTYTTFAIVAALVIIVFTHLVWLDAVVAFAVSLLVLHNGYSIIRASLAGIMDEADIELLEQLLAILNNNRRENWIDLHNLRVIKYGSTLHVDCHLTVPWYLNVREAHDEVEALGKLIRNEFGDSLELFVHTDACLPFSCSICTKKSCTVRVQPIKEKIVWTLDNIILDQKHRAY